MRAATNAEFRQLTKSCARIVLDRGITGSGYLVDDTVVATCRHVVATLAKGDVVCCEFVDQGRKQISAVIVHIDERQDVALLELRDQPPRAARPLALARPALGRGFECYGFPSFARGNPVHFAGEIAMINFPVPEPSRRPASPRVEETARSALEATPGGGDPPTASPGEAVPEATEIEISSPNLAGLEPSEEGLGGLSGSPVFSGGAVVAQLYRVLGSKDHPKHPALTTVYAVPADRILELLCRGRSWGGRLRLRTRAPLQRLRRRAWLVAPLAMLAIAAVVGAHEVDELLMKRAVAMTLTKAFAAEPFPVPPPLKKQALDDVVDLARYGRPAVAPILARLHAASQQPLENENTEAWAAAERALAGITESDPDACDGLLGMLNLEGAQSIYSFEAQKMLFKNEGEALRRCPGARQRLCRYLGLLDGTRLDWPPLAVSQVCQGAKAVLVKFGPASASCGGAECAL